MMVFISSIVGLPLRRKISGQSIRGSSAGGLCSGSWLSSAWNYSFHSCGCSLGRLPKFPSVFMMLSFVDLSRSLCLLNKKIFSEARPMTSLNGKLAMCLIDYSLKSMLFFGQLYDMNCITVVYSLALSFPVSPKCVYNGTEFAEGEVYRLDFCWLCQCRGGISFCSKTECAELECDNFYIPEGECCPVCTGTLQIKHEYNS